MVTGLLLFLSRHLTLVGIDSDEGKAPTSPGHPYFLRPTLYRS
jgi:hypothetical protein